MPDVTGTTSEPTAQQNSATELAEAAKAEIRAELRNRIAALSEPQRHAKSIAACALLAATHEFQNAQSIMLYLATPQEVDTSPLALRAWQHGKTVIVPKVSWDAKRMVPVEITSLCNDQVRETARHPRTRLRQSGAVAVHRSCDCAGAWIQQPRPPHRTRGRLL